MSDKTYAETQGEPPFDWWHALNNPGQYEWEVLMDLAADWVTCACGNQCAIIPREPVFVDDDCGRGGGMPEDMELSMLGGRFAGLIDCLNWEGAKEVLRAIEARSAVLIAEELAKRNQQPASV